MKESDILYDNGNYWVMAVNTGYEVYEAGITHSVRVARIGWANTEKGLNRAIYEADRRLKDK